MTAPKRVFHVQATGTSGYGATGGGTFTRLDHAQARGRRVVREGGSVRLFESEVEWRELPFEPDGKHYVS
jgi:hypothetical protein